MANLSKMAGASFQGVVGIDMGSSTFIVAAANTRQSSKGIEFVTSWTGSRYSGASVPSAMYFPANGPTVWQRNVDREEGKIDFEPLRLVKNWKSSGQLAKNPFLASLQASAEYLGVDVEAFPHIFVTLLLNKLFFDERALFKPDPGSSLDLSEISLVFAKPSGFDLRAFEPYQRAAIDLGFKPSQVSFVSETEAFLRGFLSEHIRHPFIGLPDIKACPLSRTQNITNRS